MKLWIWYWMTGGYNSCRADNRRQALQKAKDMAHATILKVDEKSLHEGTQQELNKLDRMFCMD